MKYTVTEKSLPFEHWDNIRVGEYFATVGHNDPNNVYNVYIKTQEDIAVALPTGSSFTRNNFAGDHLRVVEVVNVDVKFK